MASHSSSMAFKGSSGRTREWLPAFLHCVYPPDSLQLTTVLFYNPDCVRQKFHDHDTIGKILAASVCINGFWRTPGIFQQLQMPCIHKGSGLLNASGCQIDPQYQLFSSYGMNKGIIAVVFSLSQHGIVFCHLSSSPILSRYSFV